MQSYEIQASSSSSSSSSQLVVNTNIIHTHTNAQSTNTCMDVNSTDEYTENNININYATSYNNNNIDNNKSHKKHNNGQYKQEILNKAKALVYNDIPFSMFPKYERMEDIKKGSDIRPFYKDIFYILGYNDLRMVDYVSTLISIGHGMKSCVLVPSVTKVIIGPYADNR